MSQLDLSWIQLHYSSMVNLVMCTLHRFLASSRVSSWRDTNKMAQNRSWYHLDDSCRFLCWSCIDYFRCYPRKVQLDVALDTSNNWSSLLYFEWSYCYWNFQGNGYWRKYGHSYIWCLFRNLSFILLLTLGSY